jgi:multisubunit Na+/H+ antiporter MnhE subunit
MMAFALNMIMATLWLLLSSEPGVPSFIIGFITSYLLIAAFRGLLPDGATYIRRTQAMVRFALYFLWQFLVSNFTVATTVLLRRRDALKPGFVDLDVAALRPPEILLLTYCITLTPGTVSIRISDDYGVLTVHALDAADPAAIQRDIQRQLIKPILAFTR